MALIVQPSQAAPTPALPQAVEFYANGLEPAYTNMLALLSLSVFCKDQFPADCAREDPKRFANLEDTVRRLRAVTIFGSPPVNHFEKSYKTVEQATLGLVELQTSFLDKAREYEKQFLTRYAAVNKACDGSSAAETADLEMTAGTNFERFWGLGHEGYIALVRQIDEQAEGYIGVIRATWTPERCTQARIVGHDLRLLLLNQQLKAYMHPGWEKFERRDKLEQAGTFIGAVVFAFDNKVNPGAIDAASNQSARGQPVAP